MRWFRRRTARQPSAPVGWDEVEKAKPDQLRGVIDRSYNRPQQVWAGGEFAEVGLADFAARDITITRRFVTAGAMLITASAHIADRERHHRVDGIGALMLVLPETAFHQVAGAGIFRHLVDHARTANIRVVVIQSWLRPVHEG